MKESPKAAKAWADYLGMGPGRSLEKLVTEYKEKRQIDGKRAAPTVNIRRLEIWSATFGWQQRLKDIAEKQARDIADREAELKRQILETGYALPHLRVQALKTLAATLYQELSEGDRLWVRDVKQIGSGEYAERVDIERFNQAEVEQLRGLFDDIAKEKSERKQPIAVEHSGKVEHVEVLSDDQLRDRIRDILNRSRNRRARALGIDASSEGETEQ